jgi:hypothetical protein
MLSELLQQEFWLLQLPFAATLAGIFLIAMYAFTKREEHIRQGLLAYMISGLLMLPLYYVGQEIIAAMQELNRPTEQIETYERDYYTTIIVYMFMSITALMSWLMRKSLGRVPVFFLVLVELYGIIVVAYTAWRQWMAY